MLQLLIIIREIIHVCMYEVVRTGTSEANDRCSSRFSVNDEELVGRVWS